MGNRKIKEYEMRVNRIYKHLYEFANKFSWLKIQRGSNSNIYKYCILNDLLPPKSSQKVCRIK